MATHIQLEPEATAAALAELEEIVADYNDEHEDTRMFVRQLPGGNMQVFVEKTFAELPEGTVKP